MNKADLLKLLEKYREGNLTSAEDALLTTYYESFENEPDVLAGMDEAERAVLKEEILNTVLKKIDGSKHTGSS